MAEPTNRGPFGMGYDIEQPCPAGEKAKRERAEANDNQANGDTGAGRKFTGITGADLAKKEFPPLWWAVPELIPEGFSILAGRVKLGKSWLLMNVGIATAMGGCALGTITCPEGD